MLGASAFRAAIALPPKASPPGRHRWTSGAERREPDDVGVVGKGCGHGSQRGARGGDVTSQPEAFSFLECEFRNETLAALVIESGATARLVDEHLYHGIH